MCPECSEKLNYHSKKREVKRIKKHSKYPNKRSKDSSATTSTASTPAHDTDTSIETTSAPILNEPAHQQLEQIFWTKSTNEEEKTREEEFDDYLADLLL